MGTVLRRARRTGLRWPATLLRIQQAGSAKEKDRMAKLPVGGWGALPRRRLCRSVGKRPARATGRADYALPARGQRKPPSNPEGGLMLGPAGTFAISLREGSDTSMSRTTRRHQMVTCRRFKPTPASSPPPEAASHYAHNEAHHEDPQPGRPAIRAPAETPPAAKA